MHICGFSRRAGTMELMSKGGYQVMFALNAILNYYNIIIGLSSWKM